MEMITSSISPPSSAQVSTTPAPAQPFVIAESHLHFFLLKIMQNLDEKHFHLFRQQEEPYFKTYDLTGMVVCTRILPQFLDDEACCICMINHVYFVWVQKDQISLSWIQFTLSSEILSFVVGCSHENQLWDHLFNYFQK